MAGNLMQIDELLRKNDQDRYTASLFAPDTARSHIHALLAFNYEIARVRDVAREPAAGLIRLKWWKETIENLYLVPAVRHDVAQSIAKIPQLNVPALQSMIDARMREFDETIHRTELDFWDYCAKTSGALQTLCVGAFASPNHSALIGTAFAAIGIIRSIAFHARFRRMYLPLDILAKYNIDPSRFFDLPSRVDLSPVCREIADQAITHLSDLKLENAFDSAIAECTRIYYARLGQCGFNPLHPGLNQPMPFKAIKMWWAA